MLQSSTQFAVVALYTPVKATVHTTNQPTCSKLKKIANTQTPKFAFMAVAAVTILITANGMRLQTAFT